MKNNQTFLSSNINRSLNLMLNAPIGLFQMSSSGYLSLANHEMKKILNVEGYDLYRTNIFNFLEKRSAEEFQKKIRFPKQEDKFTFKFVIKENNNWEHQVTMTPEFDGDFFKNSWLGAIACLPAKKKKSLFTVCLNLF